MTTLFFIIVLLSSMFGFFKSNITWGRYDFIGNLLNSIFKLSYLFMTFYSGIELCKIVDLI